jgi:DNA-directed RNA polymerase specialized sigma24 family protein
MKAEDERAFAAYVEARTGALLRYAYLLSGAPRIAWDAVLRALTAGYADWHRAERDGPDAYIEKRILRDLLGRRWRRARRQSDVGADDDDVAWFALARLSPRHRAILVLRYDTERTDSEIADALGMTPASVRAHAAKAMSTLGLRDDQLREAFDDPRRAIQPPPDSMGSVRARIRRRRSRTAAVGGVAVLALVGVALAYVLTTRTPVPEPAPALPSPAPMGSGLLSWTPRVDVEPDGEFVAAAIHVWRSAPDGPDDEVYVLWAGVIGDGRVALLQAARPDGTPAVAQVSERGQPPAVVLDRVEPLPGEPNAVRALAVSYDGNTSLTNLTPGRGAQLLSLVLEPELAAGAVAVETERRRLELRDNGITAAWLQLDSRAVDGRVLAGVTLRGGDREELSVPVVPPGLVVVGSTRADE